MSDILKQYVKIRLDKRGELIAVMPSGEQIPAICNLTVNSPVGCKVTATIEVFVDTTEFKQHEG